MNNKEEYIKKYGEAAYTALEKMRNATKRWGEKHPDKVREASHEGSRKDGKYYKRCLAYSQTGLRGERNKIRGRDWGKWNRYKKIIAPESQLHHQWRPGTAEYSGLALVEATQHMHGIVNVIQILEGNITLLSEEEIKNQVMI
jgi:hypothetical protein